MDKNNRIYILAEKFTDSAKNLCAECYSLDDGLAHVIRNLTSEQYNNIQIGDVYDGDLSMKSGRFIPMSDEIIQKISSEDYLLSNDSVYVYKYLPSRCHSDPILLKKFLQAFDPWNRPINIHGREISNPIDFASPGALTDENIETAITTGWKISFPYNMVGIESACKFIDYLCKKLSKEREEIVKMLGLGSSVRIWFIYIDRCTLEKVQQALKNSNKK